MITATRTYEANVTAAQAAKSMAMKTTGTGQVDGIPATVRKDTYIRASRQVVSAA